MKLAREDREARTQIVTEADVPLGSMLGPTTMAQIEKRLFARRGTAFCWLEPADKDRLTAAHAKLERKAARNLRDAQRGGMRLRDRANDH